MTERQEEADYDEDFDDEDYNSEEDSDYVPPASNITQASNADDRNQQEGNPSDEQTGRIDDAAAGGDGTSAGVVANDGAGTDEATDGAALDPQLPPPPAAATATTTATATGPPKQSKPTQKPKQCHRTRRRVASAPPGGRRNGSRATAPRRRRVRGAKPVRELTAQERADHLRLMEAAGLLQANHQTPLVLGAYGQGDAGAAGLGFRELRYTEARTLLETAEQRLSDAERIRQSAAAQQYINSAASAGRPALHPLSAAAAAGHMRNLPQEEYMLVPTRVLAAANGGLRLPLTVDVPVPTAAYSQQPLYTGMRNKPGFSRDGWGVSHYAVGRSRAAAAAKRPNAKKRGAGRKKQVGTSQKLPAAA